jgi:hypothetical protein
MSAQSVIAFRFRISIQRNADTIETENAPPRSVLPINEAPEFPGSAVSCLAYEH